MTFKAIGFDIDGTLYPSIRLNLALAGFGARNLRFLTAFSAVRRELRELAQTLEYQASPPADIEEFHRFQASLVARRLDIDEEEALSRTNRLFYHDIPEAFRLVRPFRGLEEALKALREAGYPLGTLSDFPGDRKLELLGLRNFFDVSMTSEETGYLKPSSQPFEVLSERLGVSLRELLFVGNSVSSDITGAKAAGAATALLRPVLGGGASGADFVFRSYRELAGWVLKKG